MNIYIDESGPFCPPRLNTKRCYSCIGSLVIPECFHKNLINDFISLKAEWGDAKYEYKGSKINEDQFKSLIHLLKKYDILFDVTAIDLVTQTPRVVSHHKYKQTESLMHGLGEKHHQSLINKVTEMKNILENLSNPLYAQYTCLINLINRTLQKSTLYYVQRLPAELSSFNWNIDAKQNNVKTPFEDLWSTLLLPHLQTISLSNPFTVLKDFDYRYFERFNFKIEKGSYHEKLITGNILNKQSGVNLKKIFSENIKFKDSKIDSGLQIVDLLTSGVRRSLNGKLQKDGWHDIGMIMVKGGQWKNTISLIQLGIMPLTVSSHTNDVVTQYDIKSKKLLI